MISSYLPQKVLLEPKETNSPGHEMWDSQKSQKLVAEGKSQVGRARRKRWLERDPDTGHRSLRPHFSIQGFTLYGRVSCKEPDSKCLQLCIVSITATSPCPKVAINYR